MYVSQQIQMALWRPPLSLNIHLSSGSVRRHLLKIWIIQITCTTHPIHIHQKHINDSFLLISQNAPAL